MLRTKPSGSKTSGSRTGVSVAVGPSLLFLNYFAANMDDWDPKVTNGFAAERDVIRFDNPGVGNSGG